MASSRSACSIGDRTPCTGAAAHTRRAPHRSRRTARRVRLDHAERARRPLDVVEPASEQRRAAFDRGGGVVQLVGETRREAPERDHLLVVQLARREVPRPVEHPVDEDRRELGTLPGESGKLLARHDENLRPPPGRSTRPGPPTRREYGSRPVTSPARHSEGLVRAGAAIHEHGEAARENDEHALDRRALRGERVARRELPESPVRSQPLELLARRGADGPVLRQPVDQFDEIGLSHTESHPCRILHPAPGDADVSSGSPARRRSRRRR